MESALAFLDSNEQFLLQNLHGGVVWHLEIVDAGHYAWEIVV